MNFWNVLIWILSLNVSVPSESPLWLKSIANKVVLSLLDTLKYSINIVQVFFFVSGKWRSIKKISVKCDPSITLAISINVWCPAVNRLSLRWSRVCRWVPGFVTRWQHSPERQQHSWVEAVLSLSEQLITTSFNSLSPLMIFMSI